MDKFKLEIKEVNSKLRVEELDILNLEMMKELKAIVTLQQNQPSSAVKSTNTASVINQVTLIQR